MDWRLTVYGGKEPRIERKPLRSKVTRRDGFRCKRCGHRPNSQTELSVHHIVPLAKGGADEIENMITLCKACHDIVEGEAGNTPESVISYEPDDGPRVELEVRETSSSNWRQVVYGGANPRTLRRGTE